jgi:predicted Zn-dependent peptidase
MTTQLAHKLDNDMVLLGEPSDAFESVAMQFLVPAGCGFESPDRSGLASLTCEQVLRGAGTRDSRQFVTDLENLGVERHESVGIVQSSFAASLLAENLPTTLDIYADLLRRPQMPAEQIDASRAVCLQEIAGIRDEPSHLLMTELRRRYYPDPWGRPTHGDEQVITSLSADDTVEFQQRCYQPRGTILSVAGKFDWNRLVDQVERLFGDWQPSGDSDLGTGVPQHVDMHMTYESTQSHIGMAFPSVPYSHPQYFEAWAAIGVLSSGMSSRLFTEVREKRGLCYTVYASLQTQRDRAAVFCYAGTTNERAQETLDVTHGELVRLARGIEPQELIRLKARIKSGLIMQQESTSARASSLGRDWYLLGRTRPIEEVAARIDALDAAAINEFLSENPPRDFVAMILGPQPLEMPHGVS